MYGLKSRAVLSTSGLVITLENTVIRFILCRNERPLILTRLVSYLFSSIFFVMSSLQAHHGLCLRQLGLLKVFCQIKTLPSRKLRINGRSSFGRFCSRLVKSSMHFPWFGASFLKFQCHALLFSVSQHLQTL